MNDHHGGAEDGGEPRRFLPDGRPIATKRKKKKVSGEAPDGQVSQQANELLTVRVPTGGQVIVASGLGMQRDPDDESLASTTELARKIEQVRGPCTLILAGNSFSLSGEHESALEPVLACFPRFVEAVRSLAQRSECHVIVCPGSTDQAIGREPRLIQSVERNLGARVGHAVELDLHTGSGRRCVRVEPGTRFDNGFEAQRLARSVDQARVFYRRIVPRCSIAFVPLGASFLLLVLGRILRMTHHHALAYRVDTWVAGLAIFGLATAALALMVGYAWWRTSMRGVNSPISTSDVGAFGDAARQAAGQLIDDGCAGLITGSGDQAELASLGSGFYANAGRCGTVGVAREGRFGAPDAWTTEQRWSWLELEAGAGLNARLFVGRRQLLATTFFERLLSRKQAENQATVNLVASWPQGDDWPAARPADGSRRRVRRVASFAIAAVGLINVISAVLPPLGQRLTAVREVVPLAVSEAAAMIVALSGMLLLLLARGVRRGQRHAWMIAVALLSASFALHVVKGLDFEEAIVAGSIGLYLLAHRQHFQVRADDVSVWRGLVALVVGGSVALATAVGVIKLVPGHRHPQLSWFDALHASAERMIGVTTVPIGGHTDQFLVPVLMAVSVGLVAYTGWLIFSPVLVRGTLESEPGDEQRARTIVSRAGSGTLAYFALRDDKQWFFHGDTLIAYAVTQGVALVSPDPIGPVAERRQAFGAFVEFADAHGWPIAVMGAAAEWLPTYRAAGMKEMYVGDEAVVDVRRFSLDGGRNKGLRQAVNRIAKKGYSIEFHDPAALEPALEESLRSLMTQSRRGEVERGFSMTLGRVFEKRDAGLLLAVCRDSQGVPAAFCQYVPAPAIRGYSLDLMRRSERGDHPNGLTDFVVAQTITHLNEQGCIGLGLNFATMRATLAGERGDATTRRLERWFYRKMSDTMQIESLWQYNAKFDPDWVPRYACYDSPEHLVASATALAKAESWWEIPVIGRFFRPKDASSVGL